MNWRESLTGQDDLPNLGQSLELVALAKDGDARALGELFRRYEDRLRRIVRVRMGREVRRLTDSMDVVQDTYLVAMRKLGNFEPKDHSALLVWLATIATNQIRDAAARLATQKRDVRREVRPAAPKYSGEGLQVAASAPSARELAWGSEVRSVLDEVLGQMPEPLREAIVLRDYCGSTWEQVAEILGRPSPAAAKQLHHRAWIRLVSMAGPRLR